MAITYRETASWTTGGTAGSGGYYKDVTLTGLTAGSLIVAFGTSRNYDNSSGTRSIATVAGATSAWTVDSTAPRSDLDCDYISGWATVTSGTTATVRVQLRMNDNTRAMGAGVWVIPAGEWSGTPAFTIIGPGDTDHQVTVTLAAVSSVFFAIGDWNVRWDTPATPAGSTTGTAAEFTGYAVTSRSWIGQAAGSRAYGTVGLTGTNAVGTAVAVPAGGGATAYPLSGVSAAATATTGTPRAKMSLAGTVAGTATTAGSPVARHPLVGVVAGATTTVGTPAAAYLLAGVTAGTSTTQGTINLVGGPQNYPLAGVVSVVSATAGSPAARHPLAGITAGVTTTVGSIGSSTPGTGGRPKVYLAGSWQKKPGKVWTGAAWVEKPWKQWTGSVWKPLP